MRGLVLVSALMLVACGSAPEANTKTEPTPAPVKDRTSMMPLAGRATTRTVPDHLLGIAKLPGGTLGDYESNGKKYQLFIIETDSNQKAAFLLLDVKGELVSPEYIPYMGGYSGSLNGKPAFIFAKLQYLAGVVGLPKDEADPIARQLAARLK